MRSPYPLWLRGVAFAALLAGVAYCLWRNDLAAAIGAQQNHLDAAAFAAMLGFIFWMLGQISRYAK